MRNIRSAMRLSRPKQMALWPRLLTIMLFLAGETGFASPNFVTRFWLRENGLPENKVSAVLQTRDGYLWVGTYNGLARFDGVRFVNFDGGNTPELKRSRIRRLYVDAGGTLWINTYDGSLTSYQHGRFQLEWTGDTSSDAAVTL